MPYCLYLRKSRTDIEAEAHGDGETLARHERTLLALAKHLGLPVTKIYREVVSGETIVSRPVVQQVLHEVEAGMWEGVLVMEVERLARGDTIDQGVVAQAFKYSDTKIVTPTKIYEPNNEFDEEYFEFGLFMSRREYKTIRRRLEAGRIASVKEGKIAGASAPYGYNRVKLENGKGYTLVPNEETADVVRLIFKLYTEGEISEDGTHRNLGSSAIAERLTKMHIPSPSGSDHWAQRTIFWILGNPVYIGKVRWGHKKDKKTVVNGKLKRVRVIPPVEQQIIVDGLHDGIISEEVWAAAQERAKNRPAASVGKSRELQNPLCKIAYCKKCGALLRHKPSTHGPTLYCRTKNCSCVGSYTSIVEERVLQALEQWVSGYKIKPYAPDPDAVSVLAVKEKQLRAAKKQIETLNAQLSRTHDLLEQGVYSVDTFLARSSALSEQIAEADNLIANLTDDIADEKLREENRKNIVPKVESLLEVYHSLQTPADKNAVLLEVLERVEYYKSEQGHRNGPCDNFELVIYPKLPRLV